MGATPPSAVALCGNAQTRKDRIVDQRWELTYCASFRRSSARERWNRPITCHMGATPQSAAALCGKAQTREYRIIDPRWELTTCASFRRSSARARWNHPIMCHMGATPQSATALCGKAQPREHRMIHPRWELTCCALFRRSNGWARWNHPIWCHMGATPQSAAALCGKAQPREHRMINDPRWELTNCASFRRSSHRTVEASIQQHANVSSLAQAGGKGPQCTYAASESGWGYRADATCVTAAVRYRTLRPNSAAVRSLRRLVTHSAAFRWAVRELWRQREFNSDNQAAR